MVPRRPSFVPAQAVELRSLWQEQACVVVGLRRFGCIVCRWIARDLSSLKGLLDLHGVRLVGVGPEARGLQEFLDGGYFSGGACDAAPPLPFPHYSGHLRPPPCPAPSLPRRALLLFQFSSSLLLPPAVARICTPCPDVPPTVDDRVAGPSGDSGLHQDQGSLVGQLQMSSPPHPFTVPD